MDQAAVDAREEARTRLANDKLGVPARPAWQWVTFWGGACTVCTALEAGYRAVVPTLEQDYPLVGSAALVVLLSSNYFSRLWPARFCNFLSQSFPLRILAGFCWMGQPRGTLRLGTR